MRLLWMQPRVSDAVTHGREGETCPMQQPLKHADLILADNPSPEPPGILLGVLYGPQRSPAQFLVEDEPEQEEEPHKHKATPFFLNTHTEAAVSDKNVLGKKKKKKLQEGFIPLKKKAGLYAEYQKIPNGVLPPGLLSPHILKTSKCVFAFLSNKR